jgi:hypothetical protein
VATDEVIEQRLGEDPGDEDVKERLEREHTELLEELRASSQAPGPVRLPPRHPLTSPFTDLNAVQRYVYHATLLSTAVALVVFALTAWRWWAIALYASLASGQRPRMPRPTRGPRFGRWLPLSTAAESWTASGG